MKTNTANHRKHKKQDSLVLTNKQDDLKTFDIQNKLNEAVLWTLWHRINYYVSLWHLISTKCVLMPTFSPNLNPLPFSSYHSYYPLPPALLSTFPFIAPRFSSTNFKSIQHRPFPLTPPFFFVDCCEGVCVVVVVVVVVALQGWRVSDNLLLFPGGLSPRGVSTGG